MSADPPPIRVAIVNDYAVIVDGIAAMLTPCPQRFEVVTDKDLSPGRSKTAGRRHECDIIVVDPFASHGRFEQQGAGIVETRGPRYLLVTWRTSSSALAEAFQLGFHGYLTRPLPAKAFRDAVEAVHLGERVVVSDSPRTSNDPTGGWPGHELELTARESEILCLMAQGLTNEEITLSMHVRAETLKTYIRATYEKIGVTRRTQAIIWSFDHGLVKEHHRSPTTDVSS